jgi:ribosomal protein L21
MTEAEMKSTLHRQKIIYLKTNRKKKKKETQGKGERYLVL